MNELSTFRIPRAAKDLPPIVVDMTDLYLAQSRMEEVAAVTTHKAPELLSFFNLSYLKAARIAGQLEFELQMAEQKLQQIKSVILMDRMSELLAQKGLATSRNPLGSEDIREAVYTADPDCSFATSSVTMIRCYLKLVLDFKKSFEMSYNGVKKIMGDGIGSQMRGNPNLTVPGHQAFGLSEAGNQAVKTTTEAIDDDFFGVSR